MADARQLHLFKSSRQRGVAPPPPKEFSLHCQVADTLRRWAIPGWLWQHVPGGEARPAEFVNGKRVSFAGQRLQRMGFMPGWPDFILLAPTTTWPKLHMLELKRRGGKLSDAQHAIQLWALANHCPFEVVDNYPDALDVLKHWGAVRAGIQVQ